MSDSNPFQVILVITAIVLVVASGIGIIAPSLGVEVPTAPVWPTLPDLSVQGDLNETNPFNQSWPVDAVNNNVLYDEFSPDKSVFLSLRYGSTFKTFEFKRYGTVVIIPWWYNEPIVELDGDPINAEYYLTAQEIINNFNGTYSTYVIDSGNNLYECTASFYPLEGYSNMIDSYNTGGGFQVWMYGSAYALPDWTEQAAAYLGWIGALIGYFVYFVAYMVGMAGVMFTLIGLSPELGAGIIILIITVFIGSLLMFLRGSSTK